MITLNILDDFKNSSEHGNMFEKVCYSEYFGNCNAFPLDKKNITISIVQYLERNVCLDKVSYKCQKHWLW